MRSFEVELPGGSSASAIPHTAIVKPKLGARWRLVVGGISTAILLSVLVAINSNTPRVTQELSESGALAMAEQYFGDNAHPSTLTEKRSDYSVDPVTPFENMPDPDAPSSAEMTADREAELARTHGTKLSHTAATAQLALHSFFIPSPSPMYETVSKKQALHQHAAAKLARGVGSVSLAAAPNSPITGTKTPIERGEVVVHAAQLEGNGAHKASIFSDDNGVWSIFKDRKVPLDTRRKPDQVKAVQVTPASSITSALAKKPTVQKSLKPAVPLARSGASVNYRGVFGNPFHDHVVKAAVLVRGSEPVWDN